MCLKSLSAPIVFMGTPGFALPALEGLYQAGYPIQAIYTQPPRPKGRGRHLQKSPVHLFGDHAGISVRTPCRLDLTEQEFLLQLSPMCIIVAAYGLLLPPQVLEIPLRGCVNIHASLLPKWRGAAPIQRSILAGDKQTGVTLMQMDVGLDTGNMLGHTRVDISPSATTDSLSTILSTQSADLLISKLPSILSGDCVSVQQPTKGVSYASKILPADGELYWKKSAYILERQTRAIKSWFIHNGRRVTVHQARVTEEKNAQLPGTILDQKLRIVCGDGTTFQPLILQQEGGNPTSVEDFLRGQHQSFEVGICL